MRQSDHEYEERSFGDIQRAIDFENSMNANEAVQVRCRMIPHSQGAEGEYARP